MGNGGNSTFSGYITTDSTTNHSTFPYASTTALTVSGTASTTDLIISNNFTFGNNTGFLYGANGTVTASSSIADGYFEKTGSWDGTLTSFGSDFWTYFNATNTDALSVGSTNLYATQAVWDTNWNASTTLDSVTSIPNLANIANSSLTNSTISGIALGASLNTLTATNGTLTFSESYDGSTARTVGLNVGNANTWTALQTFGNASTTQLTITGQLYDPGNSAGSWGNLLSSTGSAVDWIATSTLGLLSKSLTKGYFLVGNDVGTAQATSTIFISSTGNVGIGTTTPAYTLDVYGNIRANNQLVSSQTNGASPMLVTSQTLVANLNADLLDGFDSSAFGDATAANQVTILARIGINSDSASMSDSLFAGQQYIAEKVGPLITSADCATAGWTWDDSQGICASPKMYITTRTTWNSCGTYVDAGGWIYGADNATCPDTLDNPTYQQYGSTVYVPQYTCITTASTDTLVERMTAFKDFAGGVADVTTWDGLIQMGNREIDNAQHKNWSALAVADCVDGVKDLGKYYHPSEGCPGNIAACTDYTYYGEYNTRNNMLAGWAGASGSHLPMPAEYEKACLNLLGSTGWPATDVGEGVWLWSAAVGTYNGSHWSENARRLGYSGCSSQGPNTTGDPGNSFRVFLRP